MKSIIPIIFVILLLTGAIVFSLTKNNLAKIVPKQLGVPANELEVNPVTPTPTVTVSIKTATIPTPSTKELGTKNQELSKKVVPTITPKKVEDKTSTATKGEVPVLTTKADTKDAPRTSKITQRTVTTKTIICTPVYGMANTCTEHVVVDTAGEAEAAYGFAGLSYLLGLIAFVKSKYA